MFFENVSALVANNARVRPFRAAVVQNDTVVTYQELERLVGQSAALFRELGLALGDRVAVCMPDTAEQLVTIFALLRLGAVVVPMDVRWTAAEVSKVAQQFHVAAIVTGGVSHLQPERSVRVVRMDPSLCARRDAATPLTDWPTTPESPAMLSLSSGTTGGGPSGPLLTHDLYCQRLICDVLSQGFHMDDVNLCATPLYFGAGRNITLSNLLVGATVVLHPPPYEVEALVAAVARHNVTSMFLVPTLLRRLLALPDEGRLLFPTLRVLISSGAALHAEEFEEVRRRLTPNLMNVYATTEAGTLSVLLTEDSGQHHGSVGRPAFFTEVEIVDQEGRRLPTGEIGEIRYRGPATPEAVVSSDSRTVVALKDGWFHPGDLGYFDKQGLLYVVGRTKDIIIRGGVNIFANEIEAVLTNCDDVLDASVVAASSAEFGEQVAAFVVARPAVTPEFLVDRCRASLASYKIPDHWFFVDELPKSAIGKVNKNALREMLPPELRLPDPAGRTGGAPKNAQSSNR